MDRRRDLASTPEKRPVGRPTKYKPEFCEAVIEVGEKGGWICEMAEACDVHRSTFEEWAAEHQEFSAALTRAKQKAQTWFERVGRAGLTAEKFNSSLWQKQMSARHPAEYTERRLNEHTGFNGGPIRTITTTMTPQEAAAAYADTLREVD